MQPRRASTHIAVLQRNRRKKRNDFMLKEGDGCDPVVSHVPPVGPRGPAASLACVLSCCHASCTAVLCSPSTSGVCLAS